MSSKQDRKRRGKVFKLWLVYYSIILLLPILLAVVVYNQAINVITNENKSVHQASLHQIGIQIDSKLYQLRTISTNILLNDKVKKLGGIGTALGAQEYYDMYEARKDINKYLVVDDLIQDIFIYFNNSGCMLSDSATIAKDKVASAIAELGFDALTWQNILQTRQNNNYHIINTPEGQELLYVQFMYANNKSQTPLFTIIIVANTLPITGMMKNIQLPQEGAVMLVGENGGVLSTNPDFILPADKRFSTSGSGYKIDENLVMIELDSNVSECKYMQALPYAYYVQKTKYIKTIVTIYLMVCLSLGFILVYYFSRHNYLPLEKLKAALEKEEISGTSAGMDEFRLFEMKIKGLIQKKDQLQKKLTDNKAITRNSILFSTLKGKQGSIYNSKESLSDYGLNFKGNTFSIILFEIESSGRKLFSQKDEEAVFPVTAIIIEDIFRKITGNKYNAYFIECDEQIAGIINYNQDVENSTAGRMRYEMQLVMGTIIYYINENYGMSLTVALSNLHSGMDKIRDAYKEAQDIFEYKRLKGDTRPVMWIGEGGIPHQSEHKNNDMFHDTEKQFYDLVVNGDYKGAYDLLKSIIDNCSEIGLDSLRMMKFRIYGLMNIMLDVLIEIRTEENGKFLGDLDPINRLLNANTLTELQSETVSIMDSIVQHFEEQDSSIKYKMDAVTRYINHQYYKTDLCLQMLSEMFNMSVSYLSRMYKKTTGEGLLNYIHKVRIQNAKTLLDGGMSIKTVAEKVGYYNSQALIRSFKRYQGMTPGQYKSV